MSKFIQDELHCLVEFLTEQLEKQREKTPWGLDLDEQGELETEEFMFERTLEIIQSLIEE